MSGSTSPRILALSDMVAAGITNLPALVALNASVKTATDAAAAATVAAQGATASLATLQNNINAVTIKARSAVQPQFPLSKQAVHIDAWPMQSGETSYDGPLGRAIAALPGGRGRILFGASAYLFLNTISLPVGISLESDGAVTGARDVTTPFFSRPYSLQLTPGAQLGGTNNPLRYAGGIELATNCAVRNLTICCAPVVNALGNNFTDPVHADGVVFRMMAQPSAGVGITTLGDEVKLEGVVICGFYRGWLHDVAGLSGASGSRPRFRDLVTHCWIGPTIDGIAESGAGFGHKHFPVMNENAAPSVQPGANWNVSIASDGAAGANISFLAGSPSIGSPTAGNPIAIALQSAPSAPAPSTANPTALFPNGVNRFGDGVLQAAVWQQVSGAWVINLPNCAPASFGQTPPISLSFLGCADTGIGFILGATGLMDLVDVTSVRAQVGMLVQDSQNQAQVLCSADNNVSNADMTTVGLSVQGKSWGFTRATGYINSVYTGVLHNVQRNSGSGIHGSKYTELVGMKFSSQPVGGSLFQRLAGGMRMQGGGFTTKNIQTVGNTTASIDGEYLVLDGVQFPSGTVNPLQINNQTATIPPDVIIQPSCFILPAWIAAIVQSGSGLNVATLQTSLPASSGVIWNNNGVLSIS